jgi:hypothetical protein
MSYKMGTKVRLVKAWRVYSVGAVLEQGFAVDLETLVRGGIAVRVDEVETPGRPAKLAAKAAKKISEGAKRLFS